MSSPEEIRGALRRLRRRGIRPWGIRHWRARRAVMAVTVVTGVEGPAVLLTRRAEEALGPHSGQLVLPGGRTDRWESASDAARRQLAEELGIRLPPQAVLGLLDDYLTPARLVITPLVLWAGEQARLSPQAWAAETIAVPFTDLDVEPVFVANSHSGRPVIRLPLRGGWLHAPTAAVLHQFREVVLCRRHTRVAHLQQPVYVSR